MSCLFVKTSLPQVTGTEAEAGAREQGSSCQKSQLVLAPWGCAGSAGGWSHSLVIRWGHGQLAFTFLCLRTQHAGAVETITVACQTEPFQTEFYKFSLLKRKRCNKLGFNFHSSLAADVP